RVHVEHVARVSFASRRAAKEKRQLAIGLGLHGKVIVNDEGVAAGVTVVPRHRNDGIGGDVLDRSLVRGGGGDHGGVLHGAGTLQALYHLRDGRLLLAHGHVEAVHALALLVDDRVHGDGG